MQERPIVAAAPPLSCGASPESGTEEPVFYKVRIQPLGREFRAAPGQSLLRAAEDAGIELPSSCRNGTCRSCLCQRSAGQAQHLIPWPGLSAEEKAEGWLLPCVAEACSDLVLEVPLAFALFDD